MIQESLTITTLDEFTDDRGTVLFANSFDMTQIVRLYEIWSTSQSNIRAWQAHEFEKKWFYCLDGSFVINLVRIDDFKAPSKNLISKKIELNSKRPSILTIPNGFATGIKSIAENSRLLIFSDTTLEASKNDDYRYPIEQWAANWH